MAARTPAELINHIQNMPVPRLPLLDQLTPKQFRALCVEYGVGNLPARISEQRRPTLYNELMSKFDIRHPEGVQQPAVHLPPNIPPRPRRSPRQSQPAPQRRAPAPQNDEQEHEPEEDDEHQPARRNHSRAKGMSLVVKVSGEFSGYFVGNCELELTAQRRGRGRYQFDVDGDQDHQQNMGDAVDADADMEEAAADEDGDEEADDDVRMGRSHSA